MYIEITFKELTADTKDLLIASLPSAEGFEEMDHGDLKAIFLKETYSETEVCTIADKLKVVFEKAEIGQQNWNTLWESNFSPVVVDDFVAIRASFHTSIQNVQHEIVITPKMSFGTGHHATTFLMMRMMRHIAFTGKTVFDFGTGTGVLAILAAKSGATRVVANDIDAWSIENARENFERNGTTEIILQQSDTGRQDEVFDVILANINRNVLLENIPYLSQQLKQNGCLVLSGILTDDVDVISKKCSENGLILSEQSEKKNWVCMKWERLPVNAQSKKF